MVLGCFLFMYSSHIVMSLFWDGLGWFWGVVVFYYLVKDVSSFWIMSSLFWLAGVCTRHWTKQKSDIISNKSIWCEPKFDMIRTKSDIISKIRYTTKTLTLIAEGRLCDISQWIWQLGTRGCGRSFFQIGWWIGKRSISGCLRRSISGCHSNRDGCQLSISGCPWSQLRCSVGSRVGSFLPAKLERGIGIN